MDYKIISLADRPEMKETMYPWLYEKWGISEDAYLQSMQDCLEGKTPVPQWFIKLDFAELFGV